MDLPYGEVFKSMSDKLTQQLQQVAERQFDDSKSDNSDRDSDSGNSDSDSENSQPNRKKSKVQSDSDEDFDAFLGEDSD